MFWICPSAKYTKILNIVKLWQGSQYTCVTQRSENARIYLDRVLNIARDLNMSGF